MANWGALSATRKRYDKTVVGLKHTASLPARCHRAAEAHPRPGRPLGQPLDGLPPAKIARTVAGAPFRAASPRLP
jgi:hypothetical protein